MSSEIAGDYSWTDRGRMADEVRDSIDDDIATLETSRLEEGVASDVSYNASAAADWTTAHCDRGDGKRFGSCETDAGVAVQERAGVAVLLAIAFDVRVVGPDGETEFTVVVEVGG